MTTPTPDFLRLADMLDREADEDFAAASWLMDRTTERCREKREKARKLREAVELAREAAAHQAKADRELAGRPVRLARKERAA